jgi:hypothetical protein
MGPFQDADIRADFFSDRIPHFAEKRAGELDGVSPADAGGKRNHFGPPLNHELCPDNSSLPRTAAAGSKPDNFNCACFLKSAASLSGCFKIGISRTHILSMPASNNPCFYHKHLLLRE